MNCIMFSIRRKDLDNLRFLLIAPLVFTLGICATKAQVADDTMETAAVVGFGLREKSGIIKQVDLVRFGLSNANSLDELDKDGETKAPKLIRSPLDSNECRSICMAETECQSFSSCSRGRHFECLLSRASFRYHAFTSEAVSPAVSSESWSYHSCSGSRSDLEPRGPCDNNDKDDRSFGRRSLQISVEKPKVSFGLESLNPRYSPVIGKNFEIEAILSYEEVKDETDSDSEDDNPGRNGYMILNVTAYKDVSCAIYNKVYLDYFVPTKQISAKDANLRPLKDVTIFPVKLVEACARYCALRNIRSHRFNLDQAIRRMAMVDGGRAGAEQSDEHSLLMRGLPESIGKLQCLGFSYIESFAIHLQNDEFVKKFQEFVSRSIQDELTYGDPSLDLFVANLSETNPADWSLPRGGYCIFRNTQGYARPSNEFYLQLDRTYYKFDYIHFFEKIPGLSLHDSAKSNDIKQVLWDLTLEVTEHKKNNFKLVRDFFVAGNNNQIRQYSVHEVETCAKKCFNQMLAPWPSCKSFDFIVSKEKNGETKVWCQLNTMSLSQAMMSGRKDLINNELERSKQKNNSQSVSIEMTHYEPRFGLYLEHSFFSDS